jgi:hypothetical protein
MKCECHYCGKEVEIPVGQYNYRVLKHGLNVYCGRKCSGLGRRCNRTKEEEKFIKYVYDKLLALSDDGTKKKQRHEYFKKDYAANPDKYRAIRKRRKQEHNEYCRQPKYKKYKQDYDVKRRAKIFYGEFWEAAIALHNLQRVVDNRRAKQEQKSINKSQKRKRYAKRNIKRKELESCVVGLYQPS